MATFIVTKTGFWYGLLDLILVILFIMLIVWLVQKYTPVKIFSSGNGSVPVSINGGATPSNVRLAA